MKRRRKRGWTWSGKTAIARRRSRAERRVTSGSGGNGFCRVVPEVITVVRKKDKRPYPKCVYGEACSLASFMVVSCRQTLFSFVARFLSSFLSSTFPSFLLLPQRNILYIEQPLRLVRRTFFDEEITYILESRTFMYETRKPCEIRSNKLSYTYYIVF